jgi:hypothetical protein
VNGGRKARRREERHSPEDLRPRRKPFRDYFEAVLKTETAPAERQRTVSGDSGPIKRQDDDSEPNYDGWCPDDKLLPRRSSGGRGQGRCETTSGSGCDLQGLWRSQSGPCIAANGENGSKEAQRINVGPVAYTMKPVRRDRCRKDSTNSGQPPLSSGLWLRVGSEQTDCARATGPVLAIGSRFVRPR